MNIFFFLINKSFVATPISNLIFLFNFELNSLIHIILVLNMEWDDYALIGLFVGVCLGGAAAGIIVALLKDKKKLLGSIQDQSDKKSNSVESKDNKL